MALYVQTGGTPHRRDGCTQRERQNQTHLRWYNITSEPLDTEEHGREDDSTRDCGCYTCYNVVTQELGPAREDITSMAMAPERTHRCAMLCSWVCEGVMVDIEDGCLKSSQEMQSTPEGLEIPGGTAGTRILGKQGRHVWHCICTDLLGENGGANLTSALQLFSLHRMGDDLRGRLGSHNARTVGQRAVLIHYAFSLCDGNSDGMAQDILRTNQHLGGIPGKSEYPLIH